MDDKQKKEISRVIDFLGLPCECGNKYFFTIADDNDIVCDNCKSRHRLKLEENN